MGQVRQLLPLDLQQQVRCYFLVFVPTIREIRDFYREMQRTNRESINHVQMQGTGDELALFNAIFDHEEIRSCAEAAGHDWPTSWPQLNKGPPKPGCDCSFCANCVRAFGDFEPYSGARAGLAAAVRRNVSCNVRNYQNLGLGPRLRGGGSETERDVVASGETRDSGNFGSPTDQTELQAGGSMMAGKTPGTAESNESLAASADWSRQPYNGRVPTKAEVGKAQCSQEEQKNASASSQDSPASAICVPITVQTVNAMRSQEERNKRASTPPLSLSDSPGVSETLPAVPTTSEGTGVATPSSASPVPHSSSEPPTVPTVQMNISQQTSAQPPDAIESNEPVHEISSAKAAQQPQTQQPLLPQYEQTALAQASLAEIQEAQQTRVANSIDSICDRKVEKERTSDELPNVVCPDGPLLSPSSPTLARAVNNSAPAANMMDVANMIAAEETRQNLETASVQHSAQDDAQNQSGPAHQSVRAGDSTWASSARDTNFGTTIKDEGSASAKSSVNAMASLAQNISSVSSVPQQTNENGQHLFLGWQGTTSLHASPSMLQNAQEGFNPRQPTHHVQMQQVQQVQQAQMQQEVLHP
eukprot:SAG31_NODE_3133_length_4638_cov_6.219432_7_plen_586_part_01